MNSDGDRKITLTGATEPGNVVGGVVFLWGREIEPFRGVDVLVPFVLYEHPLQVLPVDFRRFHTTYRVRKREIGREGD